MFSGRHRFNRVSFVIKGSHFIDDFLQFISCHPHNVTWDLQNRIQPTHKYEPNALQLFTDCYSTKVDDSQIRYLNFECLPVIALLKTMKSTFRQLLKTECRNKEMTSENTCSRNQTALRYVLGDGNYFLFFINYFLALGSCWKVKNHESKLIFDRLSTVLCSSDHYVL